MVKKYIEKYPYCWQYYISQNKNVQRNKIVSRDDYFNVGNTTLKWYKMISINVSLTCGELRLLKHRNSRRR